MSDRITPSPDVKARYQSLGEKEFAAFFEEIPATDMRRVAQLLPKVDGFRPTSPAGIIKQKADLARKLCRANQHERDLNALYLIWRTWIDAHFENAKSVHEGIDAFEEAAEKAKAGEERRALIEQQVDLFLEKLRDASRQNKCSREHIDRLFSFSPFPETPNARQLILAAKSASDMERDAALDELPKRLERDESEIKRLKEELDTLTTALKPIAESLTGIGPRLDIVESSQFDRKKWQDDIRVEIRTLLDTLGSIQAAAPPADADERDLKVETLSIALESVRSTVRIIASKLESMDTLLDALAEIAEAQQKLQVSVEGITQNVTEIRSDLDATEHRLDALPVAASDAALEELAARIASLETQATVASATVSAVVAPVQPLLSDSTHQAALAFTGLRWERIHNDSAAEALSLSSHTDLARSLSEAFQSLGLKKSAANVFAEECTAAALARQVIFLRGSFSTQTSRAIATSIGGNNGARISVPVGLMDAERLRDAVRESFSEPSASVSALSIEGINRSALDISREVLMDCVAGGGANRIAVIATLSSGYASLPLDAGYLDLGPVFDLDCLDWRTNVPSGPSIKPGLLTADLDKTLYSQIGAASIDTDEAVRLAACFTRRRNPSIERTFARAYRSLQYVRTDIKSVTALQSLFFGWLLPYWKAAGVDPDKVESELDGGNVNGSAPDGRLIALSKEGDEPA